MSKHTPTDYEQARETLATLEHEYATVDAAIRAAGMRGDVGTVSTCLVRKHMLPMALDAARRALAPLELAHFDAELERFATDAAPLYAAVDAAQTELNRANVALNQARAAVAVAQDARKELHIQRHAAWRRASVFAAHPDGAPVPLPSGRLGRQHESVG